MKALRRIDKVLAVGSWLTAAVLVVMLLLGPAVIANDQKAKSGAFPLAIMREHTSRYLAAGGRRSFSEYYTVRDRAAAFHSRLRRNVVFAQHNLVTDGSFNEFNTILCRNVLIYFSRPLQERVHRLLYDSLGRLGFLGLGSKETVQFTPFEHRYQALDPVHKIYRKVG